MSVDHKDNDIAGGEIVDEANSSDSDSDSSSDNTGQQKHSSFSKREQEDSFLDTETAPSDRCAHNIAHFPAITQKYGYPFCQHGGAMGDGKFCLNVTNIFSGCPYPGSSKNVEDDEIAPSNKHINRRHKPTKKPDYYTISARPNENVFIIENNFDSKNSPLPGYKKDGHAIKTLWEKYTENPQKVENLTAEEMKKKIMKFAQHKKHKNNDYVVLVILSHGGKKDNGSMEYCSGVDNGTVTTDEIVDMFNEKNAPHLKDKPKLLILQYCKGVDKMSSPEINKAENPDQTDASSSSSKQQTPIKSDYIILHSSFKGCVSYVPDEGSYLIQSLCKVFEKKADSTHVGEMLIEVRNKVANSPIKDSNQEKAQQRSYVEDSTVSKFYLVQPNNNRNNKR